MVASTSTLALVATWLLGGAACKRDDPQRERTAKQAAEQAERPERAAPDRLAAIVELGQARVAQYQRCWGLFNVKQWDALKTCYVDDVEAEAIDGGPAVHGVDAAIRQARRFAAAFPDATGEPQLILASGETIQSITLVRGTHLGTLRIPGGEVTPTGESIGLLIAHGVAMDEVGRASQEWSVVDHAALLAQLGRPPPGMPHRSAERAWPERIVVIAHGDDREAANLAAYRSLTPALPAGLRGLQVAPDQTWAAGDFVVSRGTLGGVEAGRPLSIGYLEIARIEDGEVTARWLFHDGLALARQRGLLDASGAAKPGGKARKRGKRSR